MNIRMIAKAIHENAVEHGFWENEDLEQKFALIHDEWSEALEADRNCEPLVKIDVHRKPYGVLVELIDGVIRMIDLCEASGLGVEVKPIRSDLSFYKLVNEAHKYTAFLREFIKTEKSLARSEVEKCCGLIFGYIHEQGYDPMTILEWKHNYNVTRPYKHGKKY